MAVKDYRIGNFQFIGMSRIPPSFMNSVSFESRTGVDGYVAWQAATRGKQFFVTTEKDSAGLDEANQIIGQYETAQQDGLPLTISWADLDLNFTVMIRSVDAIAEELVLGVGGTRFPLASYAVVKARWDLVVWE